MKITDKFELKPGDKVVHVISGNLLTCAANADSSYPIKIGIRAFTNCGREREGDKFPSIIPYDMAVELGYVEREPLTTEVGVAEIEAGGVGEILLGRHWIGKRVRVTEIIEPTVDDHGGAEIGGRG